MGRPAPRLDTMTSKASDGSSGHSLVIVKESTHGSHFRTREIFGERNSAKIEWTRETLGSPKTTSKLSSLHFQLAELRPWHESLISPEIGALAATFWIKESSMAI